MGVKEMLLEVINRNGLDMGCKLDQFGQNI